MPETQKLPRYTADMFKDPAKDCDVIMKGGITSGVVYPYAVLELARQYRFHSIGGTSAGAIAAIFAAAAEYARTGRGDPAGFVRLQARCDTIPEVLSALFQPEPRFRPLMGYLLRAQAGGPLAKIVGLPLAFPLASIAGVLIGAGLLWLAAAGIAGAILGGLVGLVAAILIRTLRLAFHDLPREGFGFCSGLSEKGYKVAGLTEWLHEAIQDIAFGADAVTAPPLTFGMLAGPAPDKRVIDLRMVTTNLTMRRPHALPVLNLDVAYDPIEWRKLFPEPVMRWLTQVAKPAKQLEGLCEFPQPADLPIVIAARMSLSFPILFKAIPTYVNDRGTLEILHLTNGTAPEIRKARLWFADGGISSNFPIHLFDALLPSRPTFALSLDELPPRANEAGERVAIPQGAGDGIGIPVRPIESLGGYAASILGSAKDWQDQLLATMPGQRERIARVFLSNAEGGLNLTMPETRSTALMTYGQIVGQRFAKGALDFDEHRWRRALVAYDQLEEVIAETEGLWSVGGFGGWLAGYLAHPRSYQKVTPTERAAVHARLAAFATLAQTFTPQIKNKRGKFPRPIGRLRIGPNV